MNIVKGVCYISVCTNFYFKYSVLLLEFISTVKKLSKYSAFGLKSLDHFSVLKLWPQHADKCGRKKTGFR